MRCVDCIFSRHRFSVNIRLSAGCRLLRTHMYVSELVIDSNGRRLIQFHRGPRAWSQISKLIAPSFWCSRRLPSKVGIFDNYLWIEVNCILRTHVHAMSSICGAMRSLFMRARTHIHVRNPKNKQQAERRKVIRCASHITQTRNNIVFLPSVANIGAHGGGGEYGVTPSLGYIWGYYPLPRVIFLCFDWKTMKLRLVCPK